MWWFLPFRAQINDNRALIKQISTAIGMLKRFIDGLEAIPRDSVDKGVAAIMAEQTEGAIEKSFVCDHQHAGNNVICKPRIGLLWRFTFVLQILAVYTCSTGKSI